MKCEAQEAAFDAYWAQYAKSEGGAEGETQTAGSEPTGGENDGDNTVGKSHNPKKEEMENMKFDKSKIKYIGLGVAGAAVSKGDLVTVNAPGQIIKATGGSFVFGRAFTAATAAGEALQVQINQMGVMA